MYCSCSAQLKQYFLILCTFYIRNFWIFKSAATPHFRIRLVTCIVSFVFADKPENKHTKNMRAHITFCINMCVLHLCLGLCVCVCVSIFEYKGIFIVQRSSCLTFLQRMHNEWRWRRRRSHTSLCCRCLTSTHLTLIRSPSRTLSPSLSAEPQQPRVPSHD